MNKFTTNQFAEDTTAADIYEMREEHRQAEARESMPTDFDPHRDFYAEMDNDSEAAKVAGREAGLSSYRTWASVNDNPHAEGTEAFSAWAEAFKQAKFESDQDHDDSYLDY